MALVRSIPPERRRDPGVVKSIVVSSDPTLRRVLEVLFIGRKDLETKMLRDLISITRGIIESGEAVGERMAVMGFCMGGGLAFQLSTELGFEAAVVFYGSPPDPLDRVLRIKGSVMGIYAGIDPPINSTLPKLVEAVISYGVDFEMKIYPALITGSSTTRDKHIMRRLQRMRRRELRLS